jgi:hypothetical protein
VQQFQNEVFHIFADVTGFGERGRIADGKRYIENPGKRLRKERLAGTRRTDEHHVRFVDGNVGSLIPIEEPLVMVVNRYGQHFFGLFLPDDVFIQLGDDFPRRQNFGKLFGTAATASSPLLNEDLLAEVNTFAANINAFGTFNEGSYIPEIFMTKRTDGVPFAVVIAAFTHICV